MPSNIQFYQEGHLHYLNVEMERLREEMVFTGRNCKVQEKKKILPLKFWETFYILYIKSQ